MITLGIHDLPFLSLVSYRYAFDSMENYTDGATLNGLNSGTGWATAYVVSGGDVGPAADDMESYTSGSNLDGLNGGTLWNDAYTSRP